MGVGAGVYMCDAVKKVHVRYLISWWVLVKIWTRMTVNSPSALIDYMPTRLDVIADFWSF